MARRKLTTQGRVLAAGVCVAVAGALAGLMAVTDDTGAATTGSPGTGVQPVPGGTTGSEPASRPYDGGVGGYAPDGSSSAGSVDRGRTAGGGTSSQPSFPQPQTRTGGS